MGTKDQLLIHHPQDSGCRMWTPIIPPVIESRSTASLQSPSLGKPSASEPEGLKPSPDDGVIVLSH